MRHENGCLLGTSIIHIKLWLRGSTPTSIYNDNTSCSIYQTKSYRMHFHVAILYDAQQIFIGNCFIVAGRLICIPPSMNINIIWIPIQYKVNSGNVILLWVKYHQGSFFVPSTSWCCISRDNCYVNHSINKLFLPLSHMWWWTKCQCLCKSQH